MHANETLTNGTDMISARGVNQFTLESWDDEFPPPPKCIPKAPSRVVKPPRIAESPVALNAKVHSIIRIEGDSLCWSL